MTDQLAGHENAGHEIAGHEIAGHENSGMKIQKSTQAANV